MKHSFILLYPICIGTDTYTKKVKKKCWENIIIYYICYSLVGLYIPMCIICLYEVLIE